MKRLMKKLMAGLLTGAMALSLAVPAFGFADFDLTPEVPVATPTPAETINSESGGRGTATGGVSSEGTLNTTTVKVVLPTNSLTGYFNMMLDPNELFKETDAARVDAVKGSRYVEGYNYKQDFNGDKLFFLNRSEEGGQAMSGDNYAEAGTIDGSQKTGFDWSAASATYNDFYGLTDNKNLPAYEKVVSDTVYFIKGGFYEDATFRTSVSEYLADAATKNVLYNSDNIGTAATDPLTVSRYSSVASSNPPQFKHKVANYETIIYLKGNDTDKWFFYTDKAATSKIQAADYSAAMAAAAGLNTKADAEAEANKLGYYALPEYNVSDDILAYGQYKLDETNVIWFWDDATSSNGTKWYTDATAETAVTAIAVFASGGTDATAPDSVSKAAAQGYYPLPSKNGTSATDGNTTNTDVTVAFAKAKEESVYYKAGKLYVWDEQNSKMVEPTHNGSASPAAATAADVIHSLYSNTANTYTEAYLANQNYKADTKNDKEVEEVEYAAYTKKDYYYGFLLEKEYDGGQSVTVLLDRTGKVWHTTGKTDSTEALKAAPSSTTGSTYSSVVNTTTGVLIDTAAPAHVTSQDKMTLDGWHKYMVDKTVFSGESKHLQITNKSSVAVGVSLTATVDKGKDATTKKVINEFSFVSDPTFAPVGDTDDAKAADAKKAKMYLALVNGDTVAPVTDPEVDSEGNVTIGVPTVKVLNDQYNVIKDVQVSWDAAAEAANRKIINDALNTRELVLSYTHPATNNAENVGKAMLTINPTGSLGTSMTGVWNNNTALDNPGTGDITGEYTIGTTGSAYLKVSVTMDGVALKDLLDMGTIPTSGTWTGAPSIQITAAATDPQAKITTAINYLKGAYKAGYEDGAYKSVIQKPYSKSNAYFDTLDFYLVGNINGVDAWDKVKTANGSSGNKIELTVVWDVHPYLATIDGAIPEDAAPTVRVLKQSTGLNEDTLLYVTFGTGTQKKAKISQFVSTKKNETSPTRQAIATDGTGNVIIHGNYVTIKGVSQVLDASNWALAFSDMDGKNPVDVPFAMKAADESTGG